MQPLQIEDLQATEGLAHKSFAFVRLANRRVACLQIFDLRTNPAAERLRVCKRTKPTPLRGGFCKAKLCKRSVANLRFAAARSQIGSRSDLAKQTIDVATQHLGFAGLTNP